MPENSVLAIFAAIGMSSVVWMHGSTSSPPPPHPTQMGKEIFASLRILQMLRAIVSVTLVVHLYGTDCNPKSVGYQIACTV